MFSFILSIAEQPQPYGKFIMIFKLVRFGNSSGPSRLLKGFICWRGHIKKGISEMKFFLDTANIGQSKDAKDIGVLDGVTTNPTLIAIERESPEEIYSTISSLVEGPVSIETVSNVTEEIVKQGQSFMRYGKNVYVKVANTKPGLKAVKILEDSGIHCNVTLTFSSSQAFLAAKAGATVVSPFIGRLDDISQDGMALIAEILAMYKPYGYKTSVLVSSIRHPIHIVQAAKLGAPIATMPYKVLEMMFKHPLTDIGFARFMKDWDSVKDKIEQKTIAR